MGLTLLDRVAVKPDITTPSCPLTLVCDQPIGPENKFIDGVTDLEFLLHYLFGHRVVHQRLPKDKKPAKY
jgi:hypothetical protein